MNRISLTLSTVIAAGSLAILSAAMTEPAQEATTITGKTKAEAPAAAVETFAIDPVHSTVLYRVQHLGAGMFWGRVNEVTGTIAMGADPEKDARIDISVNMNTIDTGNSNLDDHLKNADFFAVEEYPTATFKSSAVKKTGESTYDVTGDFTVRGVTKKITVPVEWFGTSDIRGKRCGAEARLTIKRSDYGVMYGVENGALGDETLVIVGLEGVATAPQQPQRTPGGDARRGGNMLDRFDTNKDGKLQKDELPDRLAAMFDELDANDDGGLDSDEIREMRSLLRGGQN